MSSQMPSRPRMNSLDWEVLHRTGWGEVRSEGRDTWLAWVWSVRNRLAVPKRFGASVAEVLLRPHQYACWDPGHPPGTLGHGVLPSDTGRWSNWLSMLSADGGNWEAFCQSLDSAWEGLLGPDPTSGATHYYDQSILAPPWANPPARRTLTSGRLFFYTEVP